MDLVAAVARMDLRDALDFAVLVEEDAQLRYEELSHLLAADPGGAGAVFRAMAVNEAKHGRAIAARRAALFQDAPPRLEISALEGPERPDLGERDLPATAREALEMALASERRAQAFYAAALGVTRDPAVRAFFEDMMRDEAEHAALLEARLAVLGAPPTPPAPRRERAAPASAPYPDRALLAQMLPRFDAATRMVAESIVVDGLPEEVVADSLGVSRRTVVRKLARFLEVAREHLAVALTAAALTGCGGGLGLAQPPSAAYGSAGEEQPVTETRARGVAPGVGTGGAPTAVARPAADPAGVTAGGALARPQAAAESGVRADEAGAESDAASLAPVIGELSPAEASVSGGTVVVIRGENLDVAQVTVDGTPARILDAAGHLVVVEIPEGGPGQAIVRITNRDGRFAFKPGFRYTR